MIPAYNCEKYVETAIESILSQTYHDFEIIFINDGSTDNTRNIAEEIARRDPRLRVYTRENRGIVSCLNEGLALASGRYIARMDGDDIAMPDRFQRQVEFLDSHPDHGLVGGQFMLIDPKGRWLRSLERPTSHEDLQEEFFKGITAIIHPVMMYRRDLALQIGGYSERCLHAEDLDFLFMMSEVSKVANLPHRLLLYRLHHHSVGLTKRHEQALAQQRAALLASERRGLLPPSFSVPEKTSRSKVEIFRRWGWWALQGGNLRTARLYALQALLMSPFSSQSWLLAACAVRGR